MGIVQWYTVIPVILAVACFGLVVMTPAESIKIATVSVNQHQGILVVAILGAIFSLCLLAVMTTKYQSDQRQHDLFQQQLKATEAMIDLCFAPKIKQ